MGSDAGERLWQRRLGLNLIVRNHQRQRGADQHVTQRDHPHRNHRRHRYRKRGILRLLPGRGYAVEAHERVETGGGPGQHAPETVRQETPARRPVGLVRVVEAHDDDETHHR